MSKKTKKVKTKSISINALKDFFIARSKYQHQRNLNDQYRFAYGVYMKNQTECDSYRDLEESCPDYFTSAYSSKAEETKKHADELRKQYDNDKENKLFGAMNEEYLYFAEYESNNITSMICFFENENNLSIIKRFSSVNELFYYFKIQKSPLRR